MSTRLSISRSKERAEGKTRKQTERDEEGTKKSQKWVNKQVDATLLERRKKERIERVRERERQCVCVCVCVLDLRLTFLLISSVSDALKFFPSCSTKPFPFAPLSSAFRIKQASQSISSLLLPTLPTLPTNPSLGSILAYLHLERWR